jgi:hypothetical protein
VDAESLWLWFAANQDCDDGLRLTVGSNVNVSLRRLRSLKRLDNFPTYVRDGGFDLFLTLGVGAKDTDEAGLLQSGQRAVHHRMA